MNEQTPKEEDYQSQHPDAVVDKDEAQFMAETSAPFEEIVAEKVKESKDNFIENYDKPISPTESEEMIIKNMQIVQAREAAMSAASKASDVYELLNKK